MDKTTPVSINAFSLLSALGDDLLTHASYLGKPNSSNLVFDHNYLLPESDSGTYIGAVSTKLGQLPLKYRSFDYRANQMIMHCLPDIERSLVKLKVRSNRVGVVLATSTSGMDVFEESILFYHQYKKWPDNYSENIYRMASVAEFTANRLNLKGPKVSISTACSSSAKAIATAKRWIDAGICDAVVTGGVDVLCRFTLRGFYSLSALSEDKCIPFSQNRKGINIGEGCGLFLLSKEDSGILLVGAGESSDAYHVSAPDPTGEGAIMAMTMALNNAGLHQSQVDYLNLHGTGTKHNDAMESKAVNKVFGPYQVPCSSSKGFIGHTLAASGAIEFGLSILSMMDYNSEKQYPVHLYDGIYDTELSKLNLVKENNNLGSPRTIMSNSFAFGGSNTCLIATKE